MNVGQTVFVVDDDTGVLKALDRLLRSSGFEVRSFQSAQAFLAQHDPTIPGCVLLDVAMDEIDGLEVQKQLATSGDGRPIVFLTGRGDIPTAVRAMQAGAVNFLTKPVRAEDLLGAVHVAIEKDGAARQAQAELQAIKERMASLTSRESEVLRFVVAGRLNKQMAGDLGIAEKTIKLHRGRMMTKMGVRTVADLVRLAKKGMVSQRAGPA